MKKYLLIIAILILAGCKPEQVNLSNVLRSISVSNPNPLADGTTIVYISTTMDSLADADKRSLQFETNTGVFLTANDTVITQAAVFQKKSLIATVKLKMPISVSTITIKVKPVTVSPRQDYLLTTSFKAAESAPASLQLTSSAISLKSNFGSEIQLTATLRNAQNNMVSTGHRCVFEDDLPGGGRANGRFRAVKDTTDATSTVTTYYSIGAAPASAFYLKCTYMNAQGQATAVKDSVLINMIQ